MPSLFTDLLKEVVREPSSLLAKHQLWRTAMAGLSEFPDKYVAFNFNLEQLAYEGAARDLITEMNRIKDRFDRQIVIELSKHALNDRIEMSVFRHELNILRAKGYLIALDDFGVEASNLNRLQELPIDIVKIDKALIDKLDKSSVQQTTLRGIAATLNELGVSVIAEGTETQKQSDLVCKLGIKLQQGYLHARPMAPENVLDWYSAKSSDQNERA